VKSDSRSFMGQQFYAGVRHRYRFDGASTLWDGSAVDSVDTLHSAVRSPVDDSAFSSTTKKLLLRA
jgi:hypothetical protein